MPTAQAATLTQPAALNAALASEWEVPEVNPLSYALNSEGLTALCDEQLASARDLIERIKAQPQDSASWETTFRAYDQAVDLLDVGEAYNYLLGEVHPKAELRDLGKGCSERVDQYRTELTLDKRLYDTLKSFAENQTDLAPHRQKFVDDSLRAFERNGLALPEDQRNRLREINAELTKLELDFSSNLRDARDSIQVAESSVENLPDSWKEANPAENGLVTITTEYPDFWPFVRYSRDFGAIQQLYVKFRSLAREENIPILDQILDLRYEKAQLLGYDSWSHYILEDRMVESPDVVEDFINKVRDAVQPKVEKELARLRELKEEVRGDDGPIQDYEKYFFQEMVSERDFGLDSKALQEYFEVGRVLDGLFDVTAKFYGIRYEPVTDQETWHEDVLVFDAYEGSKRLGRFFLDLHPRDNKYKHAAMFQLRNGRAKADGGYQRPFAALVCNFPQTTGPDSPGLMTHDDVTTFFHEFGHLLHGILSETELASQSGTSVERDFVEAPSQMFEEWAWDKQILDTFAKHIETDEVIPQDLYDAMTAARTFGRGLQTAGQLFYAALDFRYHNREPNFDSTELLKQIQAEVSPFPYEEGTAFQANFGHLTGYSSQYYGYQWALSLSKDLLQRFKDEGMMNPKVTEDWKEAVMARGSSKKAYALLEDFLGREPNQDAYFAFLLEE